MTYCLLSCYRYVAVATKGRRRRSDRGRLTLHARLSYAIAINVLEIYRYNRFNTLSYLIFCTIVLFTHMKMTSLCSASNRFNQRHFINGVYKGFYIESPFTGPALLRLYLRMSL